MQGKKEEINMDEEAKEIAGKAKQNKMIGGEHKWLV